MKFRQPSLGTNAVIFFPFLINWTLTHLRIAELGCLASTPLKVFKQISHNSTFNYKTAWWLMHWSDCKFKTSNCFEDKLVTTGYNLKKLQCQVSILQRILKHSNAGFEFTIYNETINLHFFKNNSLGVGSASEGIWLPAGAQMRFLVVLVVPSLLPAMIL